MILLCGISFFINNKQINSNKQIIEKLSFLFVLRPELKLSALVFPWGNNRCFLPNLLKIWFICIILAYLMIVLSNYYKLQALEVYER